MNIPRQHYLYKSLKGFPVNQNGKTTRRVFIEKGEIVEFRYFSPANFRTRDNIYCQMPVDEFNKNFTLFGEIFGDVAFADKLNLDAILSNELYHKRVNQ